MLLFFKLLGLCFIGSALIVSLIMYVAIKLGWLEEDE